MNMLLQLVENGTSITDSTAATDTSSSTTLDAMRPIIQRGYCYDSYCNT